MYVNGAKLKDVEEVLGVEEEETKEQHGYCVGVKAVGKVKTEVGFIDTLPDKCAVMISPSHLPSAFLAVLIAFSLIYLVRPPKRYTRHDIESQQ